MTAETTSLALATELGQLLLRKKASITTAESCTGGGVAYWLTAVAGSSAYVDRSFVTYSNKAKQQLLGVRSATLLQYGAVSEQTVAEMASGAAQAAGASIALAISGIAGPTGGTAKKPVGTVCFGFSIDGTVSTQQLHFAGDRQQIRQQAIEHALRQCILLNLIFPERPMDDNKQKALSAALSQIERQFGKGSIMRLGDSTALDIEAVSTGSLGLDIALGIGGLPYGRIVEIYGPESSGKTTLTLQVIAEAQRSGKTCAFIDAEHALDPVYAKKLGVDVDKLLVSQPDTGEQALEICDMLVRSAAVDVVIVDSVAALTPKAEIEGDMGDSHMGLQARLMSQALRKLTANIKRSNTLCIFINQIRMKIGVMFGNPETTTGGNALKFYASVRLDIRRIGSVKEGDEITGNETRVKVVKNKVAPPFKQAEFIIQYGAGINKLGELIDLGVQQGLVDKSGAWYAYQGNKIGQGKANAMKFLQENTAIADEIEKELRARLLLKPGEAVATDDVMEMPEPEEL
ncbi:UNVERIFIED_CONTAM: recA [Trichonephila clavipes]